MSISPSLPNPQEFTLEKYDKTRWDDDDDPIKVKIRKANSTENSFRKKSLYKALFLENLHEVQKLEIYLTLADCNIDGFNFLNYHLKNFHEFEKVLSSLPHDVLDEIHECVHLVNASWQEEWKLLNEVWSEYTSLTYTIQGLCHKAALLDPQLEMNLTLTNRVNNDFETNYEWSTESSRKLLGIE